MLDAFEDESLKHFEYVIQVGNRQIITNSVVVKPMFLEKGSDLG